MIRVISGKKGTECPLFADEKTRSDHWGLFQVNSTPMVRGWP